MLSEFRAFIAKGNVLDLAVAVIIGGAFGKIATSLTEAATRFALSHPAMGTILVGMATPQQFEDALNAAAQNIDEAT